MRIKCARVSLLDINIDGFSSAKLFLHRRCMTAFRYENPRKFILPVKIIVGLGPICTSRQNRNCPWQNPRTNFVVAIFVSSVASALTWLKSSNCVVGWQLACLKNCSSQSVSLEHVDSQTCHREGNITAPHRIRLFI